MCVSILLKRKEDTIVEELNNEQAQDFGVLLYEISNAKHALDAPTGKVGAKGWAKRIYMILLGVALFSWFIFSVAHAASDPEIGFGNAIASHIASFFILFVAEFILMLTAFDAWGKFARMALKRGWSRKRGMEGVQNRALEAELAEVDANKAKEYAIRVYRDFVLVVDEGETRVIPRSQIKRVKCEPDTRPEYRGYHITFELYDDENVIAGMTLSTPDVPLFRKHFDNFEYIPAKRGKEYFKRRLPTAAFMLIPTLIGVALIIVRALVLPDMPLIFGLVFVTIGSTLIIAQFNDVPVIGNGIFGILLGLIFTGLPIGITLTIVDLVEEITFAAVLTSFTPLHAGLSVFLGFGPMLIIIGIAGIVDCFKL